jgi:hypothetical protein
MPQEARMTDPKPTPEDTTRWQRRLAGQANNHAWQLAEQATRTSAQDEQMLQAAHAAAYFWGLLGDASQRAHAALLLAHAYATLRLPGPAAHYFAQAEPHFADAAAAPWERAMLQAVAANLAAARNDTAAHRLHYRQATEQIVALLDPDDRAVLEATLRVLPVPDASA